jgi:hypothetical protein
MSLEVVSWRDAHFDFEAPDQEREDYVIRTVGWVLSTSVHFLHIASEQLPDGWRCETHIPLNSIISRHPLEEGL